MKYLVFLFVLLCHVCAVAQSRKIDSLTLLIKNAKTDTARINLMNNLSTSLQENNIDSAIQYSKKIIEESERIHYTKGEAVARRTIAKGWCRKGNFDSAKQEIKRSEELTESLADSFELAMVYSTYGMMYGMQSKYDSSIIFYKKNISYTEHLANKTAVTKSYQNIAINYQMQSDFRQAIYYQTKALQYAEAAHDNNSLAYICVNMAITYENMDDKKKPEELYLKGIQYAKLADIKNVELYAYTNLSTLYSNEKNNVKAYDYAMKAVELGKQIGDMAITASSLSKAAAALAEQKQFSKAEQLNTEAIRIADSMGQPLTKFQTSVIGGYIKKLQKDYVSAIALYEKGFAYMQAADMYTTETADAYKNLSESYEATGNYGKALADFKMAAKINDSVTGRENVRKATELSMTYDFDKKEQYAKAIQDKQNAIAGTKQTALLTGLLLTIAIIVVTIYFYRSKQKSNTQLQAQKTELQKTLADLKDTQQQLIQSEKMASLGELTAGIAHEIQNPLNFVNNFSELNKEMIVEMKEEIEKGNHKEVKSIANDIEANEEKITHHGKRADAIVKGMLQHSRKNAGQKEPTDINALCDEYLRLSYHGLRAKDKSFQANFTTNFDETIGKINLVPRDIGRVLLNLFNNAFYAVNEKKKTADENYKPLVTIATKNSLSTRGEGRGEVEIIITDNGSGIPQHIINKIFQPFFTTKPTGEGTGLGLSLSYDIITKEHNGTIQVESAEGKGSRFIITLPS